MYLFGLTHPITALRSQSTSKPSQSSDYMPSQHDTSGASHKVTLRPRTAAGGVGKLSGCAICQMNLSLIISTLFGHCQQNPAPRGSSLPCLRTSPGQRPRVLNDNADLCFNKSIRSSTSSISSVPSKPQHLNSSTPSCLFNSLNPFDSSRFNIPKTSTPRILGILGFSTPLSPLSQ